MNKMNAVKISVNVSPITSMPFDNIWFWKAVISIVINETRYIHTATFFLSSNKIEPTTPAQTAMAQVAVTHAGKV